MFLEIDIGNTRLKWRLRDQGAVGQTLAIKVAIESEDDLDKIFSGHDLSGVKAVYISSVVLSSRSLLLTWCRSRLFCEPVFAEVSQVCSGVINGYHEVSQMGVDRWLALLAAYHRFGSACLVIDVGSAATVDLLMSNGKHLGGYIVPGLQMMSDALFRDTSRVKLDLISYDDQLRAGVSTRQAVAAGLPLMLLGMVRLAYDELCMADMAQKPKLVLTGGDGEYVAQLLRRQGFEEVKSVPDLVLDGLQISIDHDEKGLDK